VNIIEIPPSWRDRALIVTHVTAKLDWFGEDELREAESFRSEKRREEWLCARMALKRLALNRGLATDPRRIRLTRPHVIIDDVMRLYASLSHSERFAAAAIDDAPIGIDVQVVREISEKTSKFFLSSNEAKAMRHAALTHRLLHFWCAKEAEWKRRGGDPPTLKKVPLTLQEEALHSVRFDTVETIEIAGAIAALTRPTS
jgi:phosphopantetheinyl transferase